MKFLIVENRENETLDLCRKSLVKSNLDFVILKETESSGFDAFSKNYIHLSTNSKDFELICFRRYFILLDYIEKNKIGEFVLMDSDIIVFDGIGDYIKQASTQGGFVGSYVSGQSEKYKRISPHISIWTADSLRSFVEYISGAYSSNSIIDELNSVYGDVIKRGELGGVSDMTLLFLWARKKSYFGSTSKILNGMTFDHNITVKDNYRVDEFCGLFGIKRIRFYQNLAWGRLKTGERIQFVGLHFQGKAKKLMPFVESKFLFSAGFFLLGLIKKTRKNIILFRSLFK